MVIGGVSQGVDDLKRTGLLTLNAVGVHRVHQEYWVILAEFTGNFEAVIEVSVNLNNIGTVGDGLREFTHRNLAVRHEYRATHPRLKRICRCRR